MHTTVASIAPEKEIHQQLALADCACLVSRHTLKGCDHIKERKVKVAAAGTHAEAGSHEYETEASRKMRA
jgi:hypothetical protein